MGEMTGYGVCIRNHELTVEELKKTVTYQELQEIGFDGIIEVVHSETHTRPKLEALINEYGAGEAQQDSLWCIFHHYHYLFRLVFHSRH